MQSRYAAAISTGRVKLQELVDPLAWEMEAFQTCEGINHESATVVDGVAAGQQLATSTAHFAERDAAFIGSRRNRS